MSLESLELANDTVAKFSALPGSVLEEPLATEDQDFLFNVQTPDGKAFSGNGRTYITELLGKYTSVKFDDLDDDQIAEAAEFLAKLLKLNILSVVTTFADRHAFDRLAIEAMAKLPDISVDLELLRATYSPKKEENNEQKK